MQLSEDEYFSDELDIEGTSKELDEKVPLGNIFANLKSLKKSGYLEEYGEDAIILEKSPRFNDDLEDNYQQA